MLYLIWNGSGIEYNLSLISSATEEVLKVITFSIVPKIFGIKYGCVTLAFIIGGNFLSNLINFFLETVVYVDELSNKVRIWVELVFTLISLVISYFLDDTLDALSIFKFRKELVIFSDFGIEMDPNVTHSVLMDVIGNISEIKSSIPVFSYIRLMTRESRTSNA